MVLIHIILVRKNCIIIIAKAKSNNAKRLNDWHRSTLQTHRIMYKMFSYVFFIVVVVVLIHIKILSIKIVRINSSLICLFYAISLLWQIIVMNL